MGVRGCNLTIKESILGLRKVSIGIESDTIMNIQILENFWGGTEEEYVKCLKQTISKTQSLVLRSSPTSGQRQIIVTSQSDKYYNRKFTTYFGDTEEEVN